MREPSALITWEPSQPVPLGAFWQMPDTQLKPDAQSAWLAQVVLQALVAVSQRNGAQLRVPLEEHEPELLQRRSETELVPTQLLVPHVVVLLG